MIFDVALMIWQDTSIPNITCLYEPSWRWALSWNQMEIRSYCQYILLKRIKYTFLERWIPFEQNFNTEYVWRMMCVPRFFCQNNTFTLLVSPITSFNLWIPTCDQRVLLLSKARRYWERLIWANSSDSCYFFLRHFIAFEEKSGQWFGGGGFGCKVPKPWKQGHWHLQHLSA